MLVALTPSQRRLIAFASVGMAGVIAFLLLPWNVLRAPVASYIGLDGVTIANATWSADPVMARADRVVLFYSVPSLLTGGPDYVQLTAPEILLERNADGASNWQLAGGSENWPPLSAIDVDRGNVVYRDPALRADIGVAIQTRAIENKPSSVEFAGKGRFRGEAVTINGSSGGLVSLRHTGDPYPLTTPTSGSAASR